jgi:hypothetical protein
MRAQRRARCHALRELEISKEATEVVYSLVEARGPIPVLWSQMPSFGLKADPVFCQDRKKLSKKVRRTWSGRSEEAEVLRKRMRPYSKVCPAMRAAGHVCAALGAAGARQKLSEFMSWKVVNGMTWRWGFSLGARMVENWASLLFKHSDGCQ